MRGEDKVILEINLGWNERCNFDKGLMFVSDQEQYLL